MSAKCHQQTSAHEAGKSGSLVALPVGERMTRSFVHGPQAHDLHVVHRPHGYARLRFGVKSLMSNALIRPLAPETLGSTAFLGMEQF